MRLTQEKVYKVSNYTVVVTLFQMYNNYAEDKFDGGVISIFVFPLATTTEVLALTAIGSMWRHLCVSETITTYSY